jgi:hypothetical protein
VLCLVGNSERKTPFGRYRYRYEDNIKMEVKLRTRLSGLEGVQYWCL